MVNHAPKPITSSHLCVERETPARHISWIVLAVMQYDMHADRVGWTVFDISTGRPVTWADVRLTGVDLDTAHELLTLLHRQLRLRARAAWPLRIPGRRSDSVLVDAAGPPMRRSEPFRRA